MVSKLILLRHGLTEGNQKGWFYGGVDIPLAEQGRKELSRLRQQGIYPELPEDAQFVVSGLKRTIETMELIYGEQDYKVIPNLAEMNFGIYECHTYDEMKEDPAFQHWIQDPTGDEAPEEGESRNGFQKRVSEGLHELINLHRLKMWSHRHGGEDAVTVMVCHGGVISAMMMEMFPQRNGNMWDWIPDPGFGYVVEIQEGEPVSYEELTDIKRLGFGLMRLPLLEDGTTVDVETTKKMVDRFMERGYNYFDTAYGYHNGTSEGVAKKALVDRYPRERFHLATKLPAFMAKSQEEAEAMFETSLERTGAGYFDYYLLHNLGEDRTHLYEEYHLWDFVKQKKLEGKIRNFGFSFHGKAAELEEILAAHNDVDFVQLQLNYMDWEDGAVESRKCYEVARAYVKPIIVMEPIRGGNLVNLPEEPARILAELNPEESPASWALRFAMGLPGVLTVLSGMSNPEQMEDNLGIADRFQPLNHAEREGLARVADTMRALPHVPCTNCGYCVKGCPQEIAIPGIFKAMNNDMLYHDPGARFTFKWQTRNGGIPSKCIGCGQCEEVCPQHISIIEELAKGAAMFEETSEDA